MKRIKSLLFLVLIIVLINSLESIAHEDTESETLDQKLNHFLSDTKITLEDLRKQKDKKAKVAYKKLRLINKGILKALNTIPPAKCLDTLDKTMQDFYSLVSELNIGISCGPAIIPPFLPGTNNTDEPIIPDCLPPPEMRTTPFNGAFSVINPLYENALDVFRADTDENDMPDVCEGNIE